MQQLVVKVHQLNIQDSQQVLLSLAYHHPIKKQKPYQNYYAIILSTLILVFFFMLNWMPQ